MSPADGAVLVRYQGQSRRRRSMSAGSQAERAYQVMSRVWMRNPNGTVRSTAFRVRLQASPTPRTCLPAALDGSLDHRQECARWPGPGPGWG